MEYYKNLDLADIKYVDEKGIERIERWKYIPDYVGLYQGSDLGRIKSIERFILKQGKYPSHKAATILKQSIRKKYLAISLRKQGYKQKNCSVHTLIAKSFIPNIENKPDVNHKNTIKSDNRKVNLEWNTKSENTRHAWDNGLCIAMRGELHPSSTLTNHQANVVRRFFRIFPKGNQVELAKKLGTNKGTIRDILRNKSFVDDNYKGFRMDVRCKTLTREQIIEIRKIGKSKPYPDTAKEFGTTRNIVANIVRGISFKNII